jgi:hypothetical protein
MPPTLQEVQDEFSDAGLDPALVTQPKLDRQLRKAKPLYAGVLASGGEDYEILLLLHVCHYIALPHIQAGINGGDTSVTSASAGEVSVSYGEAQLDPKDPTTWTTWGLQLWGPNGLRRAQGPFGGVGKGPPLRHR